MPRVYRPRKSGENAHEPSTLLKGFIRAEVLSGALLMTVGGFVVRVEGNYSLVVVGVTLLSLGLFRLTRSYNRRRSNSIVDEDRILNKLRYHFDANYSLVVDYELPDGDVVPYLVLGPPGVLLLERWNLPGHIEEVDETWRREFKDEVSDHPNPRERNADRLDRLRSHLGSERAEVVPLDSLVVVTTGRAQGEPLEADDVVHLQNLLDAVRERTTDSPLDWEEVNELEEKLGLEPD